MRLLIVLLLALGSVLVAPPPAHAEGRGVLSLSKEVAGWADDHQVDPNEPFVYTIVIGCSNGTSGGCTNAVLEDELPAGLILDGDASDISLQPPNAGTASVDGNKVTVTFTQPLDDPEGGQGIQDQATIEIHIPVRVDPDISPDFDGQNLTNTASVEGSNTNKATDDFTVVPNVPTELEASTDKSFDPDSAVADPGSTTTLTLTGGNKSNVAVDEIVLTDPSGDFPGAFGYLGLTSDTLDVTLPEGAEQAQIDCWVDGSWVDGSPNAPPAKLPGGVDPAECQGLRIHFISTDDEGIPPGESGTVAVELEQRDNIADAGEGPIHNEVSTTVTAGDDISDPATASDDYTITSADLPLDASKSFKPDTIAAGGTSTVTLGATNSSDRTLNSLSITEPGGDPNIFENGLTFAGWSDGVQWPSGATGASVTYTYDDGSTETLTADSPDTLPDPPDGKVVTGFTVEFTGPIVAGAEATIPFEVVADETQGAEVVEHPNTISAESSAPGGYHGEADADDTLTTIEKRLAVEVDKKIKPDEIFSIPGQEAVVELTGKVSEFPESTTDAHQIIVQDPADLANDGWYDAFAPKFIAETPIPSGSTLTVQYWDGSQWIDVPGMVGLEGPQIFTGELPPEVQEIAKGIRFIYDSEDGFPPGTTVNPNIDFELKPEMAGEELQVEDCASSAASTPEAGIDEATAEQKSPDCPAIELIKPDPGNADFIEKDWDSPKTIGERSQQEHGASLRWSTSGASGIDQMRIYDVPDPTPLSDSVYDSFDLVRIDPITSAMDPLLTYDRVAGIRLFSRSGNNWIAAPNDPCPAACDGTFPGYTLTAEQRADVIGFALMFEESPTRADRIGGNPAAPRVGSGVARSSGNNRTIHPVFQIRDELRSDSSIPVIAERAYNVSGNDGEVRNDVSAEVWVDNRLYYTDHDSDIIVITPVEPGAEITKDWAGGPLGVPAPGTATYPDEYPTGRVNLDASNTTPRKVDRLTITEPTGGTSPFDQFNLRGFTQITNPSDIGATDVVITLQLAGAGGTRTLTRDEALAATEDELSDVVGFAIVYTGRIDIDAHALVSFDTRLRQTDRTTDAEVTAPATVQNEATVDVEDLIDYPTVEPVHQDDHDDATIELAEAGIGLEVTKNINPSSQTEPDRSPVTVRLTGQPEGPSRTNWMEIVDEDYTFFNQYDFVGFSSFAFTAPIDRVQVDAYVGGTLEADGDTVNRVGGAWVNGVPGTELALPDGVSPADVIGLRFTFAKADGTIWENPSTPLQAIEFQVQRRKTLRTGGPVRSDLTGHDPAPGEENAGEAGDTIQGENRAADTIGDEPLTAHDEATDTIVYQHARNSVAVTKSPDGAQPPGGNIPYTLTFTNNGDVPITDPVITDHIPSDDDGPMLVFDPEREQPGTGYTYDLTGAAAPDPENGPAMPTDPAGVTVRESADEIRFTFPEGTVLEVGQTYTITLPLQFRPGLPGNTDVTNTTGITGDRPWDECDDSLDEDSGECQASSTVHPVKAGALSGQKSVKAADDDDLGVLNTRNLPDPGCVPSTEGFYRNGCVPITKPGSDEIWRMTFTNTGNLPQDRVYAIDRLPIPDDTGVITGDRGSQWRPTPKAIRYAGVTKGTVSEVRIYYDTDQELCTDDLKLGQECPDGAWTLLETIPNPTVGGAVDLQPDVTAIKIEADFFGDGLFQPTGTVSVDLITTTPAQSPTVGPDTIAWNNVTVAARNLDGDVHTATPATEGNKVGVALATGPLQLRKDVTGPAAQYAPESFSLTLECTSVGEEVDLGDRAKVTITADEIVTIAGLPWGSECTVSEDAAAAGNPEFSAITVTVVREDQTVPILIATNVYPAASLVITKSVEASATDEEGNPLTYGPFVFTVECTYLDQPVYATGYDSDRPMVASFSSGESVAFAGLPAGASCMATETEDDGADSTTSVGTAGDADPITGTTVIGPLVLAADGENELPTNEVAFTNTFATGSLTITKQITGAGADAYGTGPFFVQLTCVDADDTRRVVFDGETQLGDGEPLSVTVENLYVDSICRVTETGTGGATSSTVSPAGAFRVTADSAENPVQVSVTNRFDVGSLRVVKKIVGDKDQVSDDQLFRFGLSCELMVNGEEVELDLGDDAAFELSIDGGLSRTFDGLPTGAVCTVTETDDGGADRSIVQPEQVTIGNTTTVDVLATNTFDPPPTSPKPPTSPSDHDPLANTGGPTLLVVLAGLVLLAVGGTLLRRRRRQS